MVRKQSRRSDCPINFALQTFGDTWSLLVIRDIVYFGKKTYGEFLASEEGIATNILANRLAWLEQNGILVKTPDTADRRKDIYSLTDKGLDLIPILLEIANWSAKHDPQSGAPPDWIALVNLDKDTITRIICATVREGGSIFVGRNRVLNTITGDSE